MRLIDADALEDVVLRLNEEGRMITRGEYKRLDSIIFEFPTIEAEPVRRGKWEREEEYGDLWVCNQCGFAGEYKDNYCPNCGAKMDGGDENETD